jgi:hypothetical protein
VTLAADTRPDTPAANRPPFWLVLCTALLAITLLVLAVAESGMKAQYFIDQGEFISLFGLAFISIAGGYLAWRKRLAPSLPLVFPWLLYPVVTQGDQIIDYMPINTMRLVVHVLLAAIFATPVAVVVMAVRAAASPKPGDASRRRPWMNLLPGLGLIAEGRRREGAAILAAALLVIEMWAANRYLGELMIITLVIMTVGVLAFGSLPVPPEQDVQARRARSERFALGILVVGVVASLGTYLGYKNEPGAYQGSPSFFMDPGKQASNYPLTRLVVPAGPLQLPSNADAVRAVLDADAATLEKMLEGLHILDRNYTYDFHNELFVRSTPLVPNYRATGLGLIADARALAADADAKYAMARPMLADDDPLAALLDEVHAYLDFQFNRAPILEKMSADFQRTKAGLQHAAHLYEGEAKYLGNELNEILKKYQRVLDAPELKGVTGSFTTRSRAIYQAYADHVVGF